MLYSPVLHYELLTLGRRRRYTLLRIGYGVSLLIALWFCHLEAFRWYSAGDRILAAYANLAQYFFASFTGIQLGAILMFTPAVVAGTISGEHERRTIDYLLTTHLTDAEITLSKFTARMLTLGYQLLVGLPVLALVMLFGGIDPATLLKVFGYSLLILIATASLSLWISASSRQSRAAITTAYLLVIVWVGLPILALAGVESIRDLRFSSLYDFVVVWNLWSPIFLIVGSFDVMPNYAEWHRPEYVVPLYLTASVAWLGLAVRALRRTHATMLAAGGRRNRRQKPPRAVWDAAMLWKETVCQRGALRLGRIGRAASIVLFAAAYFALGCGAVMTFYGDRFGNANSWRWGARADPFGYDVPFSDTELHITSCCLSAIAGSFVLLLVTARAAGSVTHEKEQDSWLTLISTPYTGKQIALAKIAGALYSVRYWYLLLLVGWFLGGIRFPYLFLVTPFLLGLHLQLGWMCCAIGLACSLRFKTSLWSIGSALATVAVALGAAPMTAILLLQSTGGRQSELPALGFLAPFHYLGPEHLTARYFCERFRDDDQTILASCLTAALVFAATSLAITSLVVRGFDELAGRSSADTGTGTWAAGGAGAGDATRGAS
jgi:ABC-type transport system involved in multi-copper enzyme maturation permease subunit